VGGVVAVEAPARGALGLVVGLVACEPACGHRPGLGRHGLAEVARTALPRGGELVEVLGRGACPFLLGRHVVVSDHAQRAALLLTALDAPLGGLS
jgi:hypothetical protein